MGFTQTLPIVKPPATTLVSPSGSISGLLPTYTWNQVNTSTWYLLQVNANTPNHAVIYQWYTSAQSTCTGTTCSVTPSTSWPAGSYTWWVLTDNSAGDGTWSSGMGFTQTLAIVKPPATTLVSPSGTISTTTPTYTWNAVSTATWYLLQVNVNTPNHSVIYQWYTAAEVGCSSGTGTCSITPATALLNGAYTWWVLTNNTAGDGTWSSGMTCTVSVVSTGFNSQFKGDATGWETHLGSWSIDSAEYYTGTPVYDSFSSASYAANFSNFQYEAKLWRNGCAGCSSGIMFRGTPDPLWSNGEWYTGYMFVYSRTGYYAIYREDPSAVF